MFCHSGDEIITQFVNFGLQAKDTDVNDVFFELKKNSDDKNDFEVNILINNTFQIENTLLFLNFLDYSES